MNIELSIERPDVGDIPTKEKLKAAIEAVLGEK